MMVAVGRRSRCAPAREYLAAFRRSIEQQDVRPAEIRLDTADLSHDRDAGRPSCRIPSRGACSTRIDLLESLDKRHLVTPLLLHHESPEVRARALRLAEAPDPTAPSAGCRRASARSSDADGEVRLAAVARAGDARAARRPRT